MKLAFQLAYKNLIGAGLRTWLNAGILSFAFVMILFFNGLIDGWNLQAKRDGIKWEYGNGQLLMEEYDPYDPFTLQDGHAIIPASISKEVTPILLIQGSIYPNGRMLSVTLKGIDVNQSIIEIPTDALKNSNIEMPAVIGKRMANAAKLKVGDQVLLRWRDQHGTYDALNITIVDIFDTDVGTVDNGQIWMPIETLWQMTGLKNEATILIAHTDKSYSEDGWVYKSKKELLSVLTDIIETKKMSGSIMYLLLLMIALLAIFDTQVLSIFRRQKEIGTYIALGMTRWQVVGLFTMEGSMYSLFAMIVGCVYGIPLLFYVAYTGIGIPAATQNMGIAIAERIYPVYGFTLILGTLLLVIISATVVSFLPARSISKMNPVLAIKGKVQ
ncbi:MAG: FtsX-like permease family protein [Flammeovirgaceae bacterium]|jgi:putative ABC transport system permease protein|nr:FtsX-like permease family protein [Flammeovirgaceae bacterium]